MNNQFFNFSLLGKDEHEASFHPKDFETLPTSRTSALGLSIAPDCPYPQEIINKFEGKVSKLDIGCWEWRAAKDNDGLGRFCIRKNKTITTARASFKMYREDVGDGRDFWIVRIPECPTVGCCNPFHLYKSDHPLHPHKRQNEFGIQNRFQKGKKQPMGTESKFAKLTELEAVQIRVKRLRDKIKFRELAAIYQVSPRLIGKIVKGEAWHHVPIKLEECLRFLEETTS